MKMKLAMSLVPVLALGCGEVLDENKDGIVDGVREPGSVTVVAPATPMGTVSGQVLDSRYMPLADVDVAVTVGSNAALAGKTDGSGNFAIKDVPAEARVLLTFSKAGYATLRSSAVVPSTAGNVPINNGNASFGPVVLGQTNGTVKFQVFTPSGKPATGAKATLMVTQAAYLASGTSEPIDSRIVVTGEVDAQGALSFSGFPAPAEGVYLSSYYQLYISPLDSNNDGILEADGYVGGYSAQNLLVGSGGGTTYSTMSIQLQPAYSTASLAIQYASLGSLRGNSTPHENMLKAGEPIYIAFNQPVQANSVTVGLTDEYGNESLSISKSLANANTLLTLTPGVSITPGREYNLYVRATSLNGNTTTASTVAFFGGDQLSPQNIALDNVRFQDRTPSSQPAYTNGRLDASERVYVNFNQVMKWTGSERAEVFFNADLAGPNDPPTGLIGDNQGEVGNALGFALVIDEPFAPIQTKTPAEEPVFDLAGSGYTTRFSFQYGVQRLNQTTGTYTASHRQIDPALLASSPMVIKFSELNPTSSVYESAWGVPQTTDITVTSMTAIAPPTPAP